MSTYSEFIHKVVVVTGGAQGIGKVLVDQLVSQGAIVVALDTQFDKRTTEEFKKVSDNLYHAYLDVADTKAVERCVTNVENNIGEITYLVNVAGVLHLGELLEISFEDWKRCFDINTHGAFWVCKTVARYMVQREHGAIVVVGSNAGATPRVSMGAYAASKAATTHMVKCLGLELSHFGIRCNLVLPGSTETEMQRQLWHNGNGPEAVIQGELSQFRVGIPLKKIAQPIDVVNSIIFLLSNNASHITMESITVDGGATLGR